MNDAEEQLRREVALFRYGLIADLVHLPPGTPGIGDKLRAKAEASRRPRRTSAGPFTPASPPSAGLNWSFRNAARCGRGPTSGERRSVVVIDTNVVSELMRLTRSTAVMTWFSRQDSALLYLTAVTEAPLRAGAPIMPARRD